MSSEQFQVIMRYAGEECPCRRCVPGRDCTIVLNRVPGHLVQALQRSLRYPRWMRGWFRVHGASTDTYNLGKVTGVRVQPQREVL